MVQVIIRTHPEGGYIEIDEIPICPLEFPMFLHEDYIHVGMEHWNSTKLLLMLGAVGLYGKKFLRGRWDIYRGFGIEIDGRKPSEISGKKIKCKYPSIYRQNGTEN